MVFILSVGKRRRAAGRDKGGNFMGPYEPRSGRNRLFLKRADYPLLRAKGHEMRLIASTAALFAGLAALLPGKAMAYPIIIDIEAVVRDLSDVGDLLGGAIDAGSLITGSYTYESTAPDNNDFPGVSNYWHSASPYGITLNSGSHTFATDPDSVQFLVGIVNNHYSGYDNYVLHSYKNLELPGGIEVDHISWQLDDPGMTALSSDELPSGAPILPDWLQPSPFALTINGGFSDPAAGGMGYYPPGREFFIRADVTSATLRTGSTAAPVPAVPEPGSLACMALVLAGMALGAIRGSKLDRVKIRCSGSLAGRKARTEHAWPRHRLGGLRSGSR
jgi:hypothetical protein